MLRQADQDVFLFYVLVEEPLIQEATQSWPTQHEEVHWLYDEFDVVKEVQQHEILLSNGRILTFRLREMQVVTSRRSISLTVA